MPNDQVRTILHTIVTQYGPFDSSDNDQRRCRGLLRDLAPGYTLEVNLLLFALASGAPEELAARRDNLDVVAPRLAHRLQETQGISEENAAWSINAWAFALGLDAAAAEAKRKQQEAAALAAEQERQRVAAEQARQAAIREAEAKRKQQEAAALAAEQERQRVAAEQARQAAIHGLRSVMQDRHRPAQERLAAGLRLDDMGVLPEGLDDFIAVPGTDFRIGKYPVTNHQFRRFVDAGGYGKNGSKRPPWWNELGWEERQIENWAAPRHWDKAKFNRATQPVVSISWYEAEAYCAWLNHVHHVPAGFLAQLPTREQWVLAARNGQKKAPPDFPRDGVFDRQYDWRARVHSCPAPPDYPWDGVFDPRLANTRESGLVQTTPVDMYPDGATKAGVFDLAGNVWEWTSELHSSASVNQKTALRHLIIKNRVSWMDRKYSRGDYSNWYWIIGGSTWTDANSVKASAAVGIVARNGDLGRGCRVVVVPISRS